ncbi:hypothetical protein [Streptomyces sp. NBC_00503]|uniref:hypothetical protein n=1 Tax=Streptomyces sp. NBC_00503 TaxID=2903659 RepID=UPI002E810C05|nr:hypothetical protein [Streptomyces sp. NBC_00503]WUD81504.1 hypothetical protein OG490_13675 [Streptomyces sp. NBC_00503]
MNPTTRPTRTPQATHPRHPRQATRTSRPTAPTGTPTHTIPTPTTPVTITHRQLNLATRHQLTTTAGIPPGTITSRTRPGGPWQRLLPRVYLLQTGPPDHRQRVLAAVLYAAEPGSDPLSGDTAALTGGAALALLGIREAPYAPADVLIRAPRRLGGSPAVRPFPTTRWPRTITVSGIPCTRPVRAAADFAARTPDPDLVRTVLANVVQSGWCHPQDLRTELGAARLLARPAIRSAAAELVAGVRSVAEAQARDTLSATDLPTPLWNARLHTPDGTFLASPDAYWPDEGVALEIDSAEYHYTRDSWHATLLRRLRLEAHGILVVSATPSMIRDTPTEVVAALRTLLALATTRPTPPTAQARGHQQLMLPGWGRSLPAAGRARARSGP